MSNFRGSFIPPVLCLVLVIQPQEGLSRNYEQRLLENKAGHTVQVFKKYSECYFSEKNDGNKARSVHSNENQVHFKCSINNENFKLPFNIILWKMILDKMSKISSNIEKFVWKILLKLFHKTETKESIVKLKRWK